MKKHNDLLKHLLLDAALFGVVIILLGLAISSKNWTFLVPFLAVTGFLLWRTK